MKEDLKILKFVKKVLIMNRMSLWNIKYCLIWLYRNTFFQSMCIFWYICCVFTSFYFLYHVVSLYNFGKCIVKINKPFDEYSEFITKHGSTKYVITMLAALCILTHKLHEIYRHNRYYALVFHDYKNI